MKQRYIQCTASFETEGEAGSGLCPACRAPFGIPEEAPPPPPLAGPCRRWAARYIDLSVAFFFFLFLLGGVFLLFPAQPGGGTDDFETRYANGNAYAIGQRLGLWMIVAPFVFLSDAILYALFGGTPGKCLFGLTAVDKEGKKLTRAAYLKRNFRVYLAGFGLALPFIQWLAMLYQCSRLTQGKPASYDAASGQSVIRIQTGFFRTALAVGMLLFLMMFKSALAFALAI